MQTQSSNSIQRSLTFDLPCFVFAHFLGDVAKTPWKLQKLMSPALHPATAWSSNAGSLRILLKERSAHLISQKLRPENVDKNPLPLPSLHPLHARLQDCVDIHLLTLLLLLSWKRRQSSHSGAISSLAPPSPCVRKSPGHHQCHSTAIPLFFIPQG